MCGICGEYIYGGRGKIDHLVIERMMEVMKHRGPDDQGSYFGDEIGLGHRRLSIIDLSSLGRQPMCNEDKTVWVVFNGEIFNYLEIREELEARGHVFVSKSDTEVIVHAYEEYGIECVHRFNGMFSIGIWDDKRKRVVLIRDRVGVKPLYYYLDGNVLIWASEIKAILENPSVPKELDMQALCNFLTLHYVPAPRTMFRNIQKLKPGSYLICNKDGVSFGVYWKVPPPTEEMKSSDPGESYYRDVVYESLKESVRKRLQSDVPVGVLLSGGLDSTAILGLATELNEGQAIQSFTVGYSNESDKFSEFEYARKASRFFGSNHHEVVVDSKKFMEFLPKAAWYEDEPISEDSAVPLHYVSKLAKENGVTVLLTGEGSDELFAGYNRHWGEVLSKFYRILPESLRDTILHRIIYKIPRASLLQKGHRSMNIKDFNKRYLSWHTVYTEEMRRDLIKPEIKCKSIEEDVFDLYFDSMKQYNGLSKILAMDFCVWLPDDLLMKKDKMGMSASIEARVPFLDYTFVELAFSIPEKYKVKKYQTKYILKKSMERLLPKEIIYRKKEGFPTPISEWLRSDMKEFTFDHLLSSDAACREYFNIDIVEKILKNHVEGKMENWRLIYPLLNFELWHRNFF